MARIVGAITGACLILILYYVALDVMDKKYTLLFKRKNQIISSKVVYVIGVLTGISWIAIFIGQKKAMSLPILMLTMCLVWSMSVLAIIDWKSKVVPNQFLKLLLLLWIAGIALYIIFDVAAGMALFFQSIAGALVGGVIFLLCYVLSRKQLGAGDVKLAFIMGLYLTGQRIIGAIFYGVLICCLYSLVQLCRKKVGMKDEIPLVPFLYMGVLITLLIL